MLERKIATYDKTNFKKRLNEFLEVAKIYKQDDQKLNFLRLFDGLRFFFFKL